MKKKIMIIAAAAVVVIAFLFLFLREKPFEDRLQQTLGSLNSYLLEGVMEVAEGEDTKSYDVSVKYLKQDDQDYFRVAMKDSGMDQEQEIIRNAEGVFVVTPTLNQIFKFQGNWPSNSLKPYLLQSMREIAADESGLFFTPEQGGFTTVDDATSFYLNEDGSVTLVFPEYSIAAGAAGIVESPVVA